MKKTTVAIAIVLIVLIVSASAYGAYNLIGTPTSSKPSPEPSSTPSPTTSSTLTPNPTIIPTLAATLTPTPAATSTPIPTVTPTPFSSSTPTLTATPTPSSSPISNSTQKRTITVTDCLGSPVTITVPVQRVICLERYLTTFICALGCEDKIIGRDSGSDFPPSVLNITSVGKGNAELMLELHPDLIIGSPTGVGLQQLLGAGIPIFQIYTTPTDSYKVQPNNDTNLLYSSCNLATTLGEILGAEQKAAEYANYVRYYANLMTQRISTLSRDQEPKVFFEVFQPYETLVTSYIHQCGGINIAENETFYYPTLSAEFVVEQNPDIYITFISSTEHNATDFQLAQDAIMTRPELAKTNAVVNEQVYIMDWAGFGGGANFYDVVGYIQWAKWIQPTLFRDIKPADVQSYLSQEFFGNATLRSGVYWYP